MDFSALTNIPPQTLVLGLFVWLIMTLVTSSIRRDRSSTVAFDTMAQLAGAQTERLNKSSQDLIVIMRERGELLARVNVLENQISNMAFESGEMDRRNQEELKKVKSELDDVRKDVLNKQKRSDELEAENKKLSLKVDELQLEVDRLKNELQNVIKNEDKIEEIAK